MLVISLLPSAADAALCLDNLAEAEFSPQEISLVMRSSRDVRKLASTSGALNGIEPNELATKLKGLGLPVTDAQHYRDAVLGNELFLAVAAPPGSEGAAEEIIKDSNGREVRVLGER